MSPNSLADPLFEHLLRSFPADKAYARVDWTADAMPDPVRHYLEHLLRHHSRREARRLRRARTDWVNYNHPEMEQAVRTFFATVEDHTQVPSDQWGDTLRTATRRTTAHLVQPVSTLVSFVFDEHTDSVSPSQVLWRLQFFGPYAYLREAVEAFVEKRDPEVLDRDTLERVLRRVDQRVTSDYDAEEWLRQLDPLFETTRQATGHNRAPLSLLHSFFEEKETPRIVRRLETYRQSKGADAVSPDTLRRLIEDATTPDPSADPRDAVAPASPTDAPLRDATDPARSPDAQAPPSDKETSGPTPLWKQFQEGRPQPNAGAEAPADGGSQPLWTQFRQDRSSPAPGPEPTDVREEPASRSPSTEPSAAPEQEDELLPLEREVLGTGNPSHRAVYIQKLFEGDETAYRRVLERLRDTESWSVASQIIARDIFRTHQVNIYSDAAVHFTNAVEATLRE